MQPEELFKLFTQYCPIWYYTKQELYMPATFEDILSISTLAARPPRNKTAATQIAYTALQKLMGPELAIPPERLDNIIKSYAPAITEQTLIHINKGKRQTTPVGKQILCRTMGIWKRTPAESNGLYEEFIDLQYITLYTWNGTLDHHAFDAENIVVRLVRQNASTSWDIKRVYGSSHGNGMWTDKRFLELEDNKRPVIYCAAESHSMYFKPGVYKRMFRFSDDICRRDIRWQPTEFIHVPMATTAQILRLDLLTNQIVKTNNLGQSLDYYRYIGFIGDNNSNQVFPLSIKYLDTDTNNLDGYYKYEGGINNLFNGRHAKISTTLKYILYIFAYGILILTGSIFFTKQADTRVHKILNSYRWILATLSIPALIIIALLWLFVN